MFEDSGGSGYGVVVVVDWFGYGWCRIGWGVSEWVSEWCVCGLFCGVVFFVGLWIGNVYEFLGVGGVVDWFGCVCFGMRGSSRVWGFNFYLGCCVVVVEVWVGGGVVEFG